MCRVEERVYISAEGHRSTFEEAFPCDKSRRGRLCSNAQKRTTEYYPKKGNTIPRIDDDGGPGSESSGPQRDIERPSSSTGYRTVRPEIIIEFGSNKSKGKKYPQVSVSNKRYKRPSLDNFTDPDTDEPIRTGFPEAELTLGETTLADRRGRVFSPSLDGLSDPNPDSSVSSGATADWDINSHDGAFLRTSSLVPAPHMRQVQQREEHNKASPRFYNPEEEENIKQVRFELGRQEHGARERAEMMLAEKEKERAQAREEARSQARRRRNEEQDDLEEEENIKQIRFQLGRQDDRAKERLGMMLAEKEKKRARAREEARRQTRKRQEEGQEESTRFESKSYGFTTSRRIANHPTSPKKQRVPTRRGSTTMTRSELDEQQRMLAADEMAMKEEYIAAEQRERQERAFMLQDSSLNQSYYKPRFSQGSALPPARTQESPVSFPWNFGPRPVSARRKSLFEEDGKSPSLENPFSTSLPGPSLLSTSESRPVPKKPSSEPPTKPTKMRPVIEVTSEQAIKAKAKLAKKSSSAKDGTSASSVHISDLNESSSPERTVASQAEAAASLKTEAVQQTLDIPISSPKSASQTRTTENQQGRVQILVDVTTEVADEDTAPVTSEATTSSETRQGDDPAVQGPIIGVADPFLPLHTHDADAHDPASDDDMSSTGSADAPETVDEQGNQQKSIEVYAQSLAQQLRNHLNNTGSPQVVLGQSEAPRTSAAEAKDPDPATVDEAVESTPSHKKSILRKPTEKFDGPSAQAPTLNSTTNDSVMDNGQQRRRIAVACARCRRRKIRCSGDNGMGVGCTNCRQAGLDPGVCQFPRVGSAEPHKFQDIHVARSLAGLPNSGGIMPIYPATPNNQVYGRSMPSPYSREDTKPVYPSSTWTVPYSEETSPIETYGLEQPAPYLPKEDELLSELKGEKSVDHLVAPESHISAHPTVSENVLKVNPNSQDVYYKEENMAAMRELEQVQEDGRGREAERDQSTITSPVSTNIDEERQPPAKPSHEYDRFKQQTGLLPPMHYSDLEAPPLSTEEVKWDPIHYGISRSPESSRPSSYAASVLSTASLASSATDLSKHTGYSPMQIARATKELIRILQDDTDLAPLYGRAIADSSIGPEKLQRNLRRFFKTYANHLGDVAGDTLELLASQLVRIKAKDVARSIIQKYGSAKQEELRQDQDEEQSSDSETEARPVDESVFEDLIVFREFLVDSEAYVTLHTQIRAFILPKSERQELVEIQATEEMDCSTPFVPVVDDNDVESMIATKKPTSSRSWIERTRSTANAALVAAGFLESPLEPGFTRLRWQCRCGDDFYGDVVEYREGGLARYIERMQRSTGAKVAATSYSQNTSNQKLTIHPSTWIKTAFQTLSAPYGRSEKSCPGQPQNQSLSTTSTAVSTGSTTSPQKTLHFMACMQGGRYRRVVHQDPIDDIATDKELFLFLRQQVTKRRGHIRRAFSLKCIQGLYFVKFRLWASGDAEVREHKPCCTDLIPQACLCIPPADKVEPSKDAEYRCTPPGPLDVGPPVLSQHMMHMLTSPQCMHKDETLVLDQLPKRTCGKLEGKVRQPAEGWGLHFDEGQDFGILVGVVFIGLVASSLFAILWSVFKHDVQGAFGVASYMVTTVAVFVALVVNRAGRIG